MEKLAMGVEGGQSVHAPIEYDGKAGSGRGIITSISLRQAVVEEATSGVSEDCLNLSVRVFETSTPLRLRTRVLETSQGGFCAEFVDLSPVARNILRMVLSKLKAGGDAVRSKTSLMKD